jgi:RNA polymerase sigma-70 factor, ECF subfamily
MPEVTTLLKRLRGGQKAALDEIIPLVYTELRRIAQGYLRRESPGNTLQPTALIHEAYLRMVRQPHPDYVCRAHFYGVSARIMRQILVDHARRRSAKKRENECTTMLANSVEFAGPQPLGVVVVDEVLSRLSAIDERKSNLVEMRFFGGMTAEEIAEYSGIPVHTVRRELRIAQAWMRKELSP